MLISFAVTNFKSFRDRAELSLVARPSDKTIRSAVIAPNAAGMKAPLLAAAAIYGSNASGKTNFLLAIQAMRRAVRESQTKWQPTAPIPVDPHLSASDLPTDFEIQIIVDDVRYRYGFSCDRRIFTKEWLYSYPKGRERELFFRTSEERQDGYDVSISTGSSLSGSRRDHDSTVRRVRQNSLFLSAAAQDNQLECLAVHTWFSDNLGNVASMRLGNLDPSVTSMLAHDFSAFKSLLVPLIRMADSSISDIKVSKISNDKPDDIEEDILERAKKYSTHFVISDEENQITINHERESRGIKRLYALASDLLTALNYGRILIVDELETSMHAQVASQILSLFQNRSSNPKGAQIVFTTHETRLLNLQHLRRDQIWFCDRLGLNSTLYSLLDFSPRKDENFEIGYLRGRYGAIPEAAIDPEWITVINRGSDIADTADE